MFRSIRARLLAWYAAVLTALVIGYAVGVTYLYRQSLLRTMDADLTEIATEIHGALTPDVSGTIDLSLPPTFRESNFGELGGERFFVVFNADGGVLDRSGSGPSLAVRPGLGVRVADGARQLVVGGPEGSRIVVGRSLTATDAAVRSLGLLIAGAGGLVMLLALLGGAVIARRTLAPLEHISRTAVAMNAGDLDARIPLRSTDTELEEIARALNGAFDRLQIAAEHQRRFTADASHEFRTPLATLLAEFDWALQSERAAEEYRVSIVKAQAAGKRLSRLADQLLTLTAATERELPRRVELVHVDAVIEELVELLRPLAQNRGVTIAVDVGQATTLGDRTRLTDALSNVLRNAIEYNGEGGHVDVRVASRQASIVVTVRDTGVGIPATDLPYIFDRFFRTDRARRRPGGAGLGLAIARDAIEAHGGTIQCESEPGVGTLFTLTLPSHWSKPAAARD